MGRASWVNVNRQRFESRLRKNRGVLKNSETEEETFLTEADFVRDVTNIHPGRPQMSRNQVATISDFENILRSSSSVLSRDRGQVTSGQAGLDRNQRTSTRTSETSSVGGPSRQAATRSRMPCIISANGNNDVSCTNFWTPDTPSIPPLASKISVMPSV